MTSRQLCQTLAPVFFAGFTLFEAAGALAQESSAASTPASGTLAVTGDPAGAEVQLDGKVVGAVPLRLEGVAPGEHQVLVSRPGAAAVMRSVTIEPGRTMELNLLAGSPLPPLDANLGGASPTTPEPSARAAWLEFGRSVVDLPWAGLALGAAFASFLAAVVFLTTAPRDVPLVEESGAGISRGAWRAAGVAAASAGLVTGAAGLFLVLLRMQPVVKLVDALEASAARKRAP